MFQDVSTSNNGDDKRQFKSFYHLPPHLLHKADSVVQCNGLLLEQGYPKEVEFVKMSRFIDAKRLTNIKTIKPFKA